MSLPVAVTQETRAMRPCRKFEGHSSLVRGIIQLPGGHGMMTGSWDGSLRVWDLQTGKQIGNDWRDGESGVNTISLSLDEKKVASGSDDGAVGLWDVDTGEVIAKWVEHSGHMSEPYCVCWSRDGGRVMSASNQRIGKTLQDPSHHGMQVTVEITCGGRYSSNVDCTTIVHIA
jgi:WD40 repeat protein